jgi:hypothetical protein
MRLFHGNWRKYCVAGAASVLFVADALAGSPVRFEHERFEAITGTWQVQVTTYNCETGVANPPFFSLLTFDAFGTLTGTTANPVFAPGQRSPDHGIWKRVGRNAFTAVTQAFIEFPTPTTSPGPRFVRGSQRIEQSIELTGSDSFRSDASLTFLDSDGVIVLSGCAWATASRFQ